MKPKVKTVLFLQSVCLFVFACVFLLTITFPEMPVVLTKILVYLALAAVYVALGLIIPLLYFVIRGK